MTLDPQRVGQGGGLSRRRSREEHDRDAGAGLQPRDRVGGGRSARRAEPEEAGEDAVDLQSQRGRRIAVVCERVQASMSSAVTDHDPIADLQGIETKHRDRPRPASSGQGGGAVVAQMHRGARRIAEHLVGLGQWRLDQGKVEPVSPQRRMIVDRDQAALRQADERRRLADQDLTAQALFKTAERLQRPDHSRPGHVIGSKDRPGGREAADEQANPGGRQCRPDGAIGELVGAGVARPGILVRSGRGLQGAANRRRAGRPAGAFDAHDQDAGQHEGTGLHGVSRPPRDDAAAPGKAAFINQATAGDDPAVGGHGLASRDGHPVAAPQPRSINGRLAAVLGDQVRLGRLGAQPVGEPESFPVEIDLRSAPPVAEHPRHERRSDELPGGQRRRDDRRVQDRDAQFGALDLTARLAKRRDVRRQQHQCTDRVQQGEQHLTRHGHAEGRVDRAEPDGRQRGDIVPGRTSRAAESVFRLANQVAPGETGRIVIDGQAVRPAVEAGVDDAGDARQFRLDLDDSRALTHVGRKAQTESPRRVRDDVQSGHEVAVPVDRPGRGRARRRAWHVVRVERSNAVPQRRGQLTGDGRDRIETDHGRHGGGINNHRANAGDRQHAPQKGMRQRSVASAEDAGIVDG